MRYRVMSDHFFSPKQPLRYYNLQVTTTLIIPSVSDMENDSLFSIPSDQEIKDVVFSFGSYKAPDPDGMSAIFYKTYWNIIGKEVIDSVKVFLLMAIC